MKDRASSLLPLTLASAAYNLLMLASPIYLINLYDKVIALHGLTNLAVLICVALCALGLLLWLDHLRLSLIARQDDHPFLQRLPTTQTQLAFLDLPFLPLSLGSLWMLHPALALSGCALAGSAALARKIPPKEGHLLMRFTHLAGQSVMATVGAILVVKAGLSSGVIFAAAVLGARLYAPLESLALLAPERPSPHLGDSYHASALPPPFHDITLPKLQLGEALAITGEIGSGKSRLLRELAGYGQAKITFPPPDSHQSLFAYLPQERGEREVFRGKPEQVQASLTLLGISPELLKRQPASLSEGERQMLRLAQCFHRLPRLIILDTPEICLDTAALDYLCGAVLRLKAQGCSFIIATHHAQLIALCEHCLPLSQNTPTLRAAA